MKILHVTFDMRIGGTEMVINSLFQGVDETNFEMSIFCIEEPLGPWGEQLRKQGVSINSVSRKPGVDFHVVKALRKCIQRDDIDLVHCHQYTPWVYGTLASVGTQAKVIFTEHGRFYPDSTSWKRKIVNPLLTRCTAAFTAISQATKTALGEFEFIPPDNIQVIYNGIAGLEPISSVAQLADLKAASGIASDCLVLGTIARFDPIKNHTMMLRAVAKVVARYPDTMLIMVGDGEERRNIEATIDQLGLEEKVLLTGYQKDPTVFLNLFDVFLLSSLSEGTSMTLLEAMSLEKPCVVTDAGGNPEVIQHGYNGLVTENDNDTAFAEGIITLIETNHSVNYGRNGRRLFDEHFTEKKMCSQFQQLYASLI